jgi:hypothetical protein
MRLFNLSLVKKPAPQPDGREPTLPAGRRTARAANQSRQLQVATQPQKRNSVVGHRNIGVGNKTPTLQTGQHCRAMSEQCSDGSRNNVSASPQKLVHLVGCRDPKVRPEPWVRLPPVPVRR